LINESRVLFLYFFGTSSEYLKLSFTVSVAKKGFGGLTSKVKFGQLFVWVKFKKLDVVSVVRWDAYVIKNIDWMVGF
jgi:hypothetical protein